jgi:hypothetical protein
VECGDIVILVLDLVKSMEHGNWELPQKFMECLPGNILSSGVGSPKATLPEKHLQ